MQYMGSVPFALIEFFAFQEFLPKVTRKTVESKRFSPRLHKGQRGQPSSTEQRCRGHGLCGRGIAWPTRGSDLEPRGPVPKAWYADGLLYVRYMLLIVYAITRTN